MSHETLRPEIEAFLFHEARLADESRYEEWEALVTDDVHYWVPAGAADYDPASRLSYVNDNRSRLATRIRQLKTGLRHAQTPPSVMRRLISNVEIIAVDDAADEYRVASNFVLHELALQATGDVRVWAGRTIHRLRRVDGAFRIAAKRVDLVTASGPLPNLTFLI
ncbi:MAG: aromatic-ring-hydroxylating dioxygenase subunit beta [Candidatus Binatia bacterium]